MVEQQIKDIDFYIDRIIYHSKLYQYNRDKPEYKESILLQKKAKYHLAKINTYKYKIIKTIKQL